MSRTHVGVCVATNRPDSIERFLAEWGAHWAAEPDLEVTLFVHEDSPAPAARLEPPRGLAVERTSRADLEPTLGDRSWIVPRGSGASRSFPMLCAWRAGADYVLTLDDDCFPIEGEGESFLRRHVEAFRRDRWFRTVDGVDPRGIPYGDRGALPVLLNHGLWTGTPDLDGVTSLHGKRVPVDAVLRPGSEVVPVGQYFPLCAMNVCYAREALPAAYNLLMGKDTYGFDRFDDIWSGLFLKRIADHLGLYVSNGAPWIHHTRASNPFANLTKEAAGIHLHEFVWRHVDATPFDGGATDVASAYRALARWMARFPQEQPEAPAHDGYFERLGEAMELWLDVLAEG